MAYHATFWDADIDNATDAVHFDCRAGRIQRLNSRLNWPLPALCAASTSTSSRKLTQGATLSASNFDVVASGCSYKAMRVVEARLLTGKAIPLDTVRVDSNSVLHLVIL